MRRLAAALTALALLSTPRAAGAWCRSSVCPCTHEACAERGDETEKGRLCEPAEPDDCGTPLQWKQRCVGFAVQQDASAQVSLEKVHEVLGKAFAAWLKVDCGAGTPLIEVEDLGDAACDEVEYNQHDGNANVVMFRDETWNHTGSGTDAIALTTVTYDAETGAIFDADIEVNAAENTLTTTSVTTDVDLLSVLTHEAGHFLGIAHSESPTATMAPNYTNGTTSLRTLEHDDEGAICAAYPPGRETAGECTFLPRHGFSPSCQDAQTEGKCAISPGAAGDTRETSLLVAAALLALLRARSGRRAR